MKISCHICESAFSATQSTQKYCGLTCRKEAHRRLHKPAREKQCKVCGEYFSPVKSSLTCSAECRKENARQIKRRFQKKKTASVARIFDACIVCSADITDRSKTAKYCGKSCASKMECKKLKAAAQLRYSEKYPLAARLRKRLYKAIKTRRKSSCEELLGCSFSEAESHFESLFKQGMSWGNMGTWHIDHIRPISSFDLTDIAQQRKCFSISNLQPLWAKENLQKGARY